MRFFFATIILIPVMFFAFKPGVINGQEKPEHPVFAGVSKREINPKLGQNPVYMAGFGHNRIAKTIHDPLFVKVVVFKSNGRKIAICCADLVGFFLQEVDAIRKSLPDFDHIIFSCTHNHDGPDTLGIWGASPFKSGLDEKYQKLIRDKAIEAVREAEANMKPVDAEIAAGEFPELVHDNRPPIVKMDQLTVLRLKEKTGSNLAALLFWHCHPETLGSKNTEISADFTGYTAAFLKDKWGCESLVFSGAVGGLMTQLKLPVKDKAGKLLDDGTFEKTSRYGELVAEAAIQAMRKPEKLHLGLVQVKTKSLMLPVENSIYQLAWQMGVFQRNIFDLERDAEGSNPLKSIKGIRAALKTEIGHLRLGDLGIALIPGEIYPELVLGKVPMDAIEGADFPNAEIEVDLYSSMKTKYKTLVGLANDEIGYILPKKQWDVKPPFTYGLKNGPYGEINSLGPDTASVISKAFAKLLAD